MEGGFFSIIIKFKGRRPLFIRERETIQRDKQQQQNRELKRTNRSSRL
jgi:hypothetical protein